MKFTLIRLAGYVLGFILFYAPGAFFQRVIFYLFNDQWVPLSIHSICFRIPIEHILDGRIFSYSSSYAFCTYLLLLSGIIFGPIFCGRLCPAGALSELLGSLLPDKYKIDWAKHTSIAPIRYGMLAGYLLLPFLGGIAACAFCNYYLFDLLANYVSRGYIVSFSSSMLLTLILWLGVFGVFTKGGRGFCNFICPVGAMVSLMHRLGSYLPFTFGMRVAEDKCVGCTMCQKACPMRSITVEEGKAKLNIDNCICCGVCANVCPKQAISYGRKCQ